MKIKITSMEKFKFHQLFKIDKYSNIIIENNMKGVFEEKFYHRVGVGYIRTEIFAIANLTLLIIHDVDKMVSFLKNALPDNNIKSIIKKIEQGE